MVFTTGLLVSFFLQGWVGKWVWQNEVCKIRNREEKPKQPQTSKTKSTQHTMLIARFDFSMGKIKFHAGNYSKVMTAVVWSKRSTFNNKKSHILHQQHNTVSRQTERRKSIIWTFIRALHSGLYSGGDEKSNKNNTKASTPVATRAFGKCAIK